MSWWFVANYKAVRCLNLTTLNCERCSILLLHFMETGQGEIKVNAAYYDYVFEKLIGSNINMV